MPEERTELTWTIRPCSARDLDAARAICEETSSIELRDEKDRRFLLLTFCDPYVLYAPDGFVAVDADDRPVGYVFCAAHTRQFFRTFRKKVLPELTRLGPRYGIMGCGVCVQQTLCSLFAPAHLHIDLTASARRRGIGTELIGTLKAHLAQQGISRVVLTVSQSNASAVRFYKKNGFRPILKAFGAYVMRAETDK
ncbi:MAG: GNAT family N-acetyltransferase [Clostridia bacterium]|nr:GNAT family N-acetyltransferase [Clostridia bacterium]